MNLGQEIQNEGFIVTVRRRSASLADNVKRELGTLKRRVTVSASAEGRTGEDCAFPIKDADKMLKMFAEPASYAPEQILLYQDSHTANTLFDTAANTEAHSSTDESSR